MAGVIVDLTAEMAQGKRLVADILDRQIGPWMESELRAKWPRRTGRSANAWTYSSGKLSNAVEYTEHIRTKDGSAAESVLQPITKEAQTRAWTE